jgi:hypothetical protein
LGGIAREQIGIAAYRDREIERVRGWEREGEREDQ